MTKSVTNPPPMYMMSLPFEIIQGSPLAGAAIRQHRKTKKPTWRKTRRYSTTSAYSSTNPPARPGCPLSSHPTISLENRGQVRRGSFIIVRRQGAKAIGLSYRYWQ